MAQNSQAVIPDNLIVVDGELNTVPTPEAADEGKVLKADGAGSYSWETESGGTTYTAGNMIDLTNDQIAVSTTAGVTDIQVVNALPAEPVSTVLYLVPET